MKKYDFTNYTNLILPKEFIVYQNSKSFGIQYSYKNDNGEYEQLIIFNPNKFKKNYGNYDVKVGIVKQWSYNAYSQYGEFFKVPATKLIWYLINKRRDFSSENKTTK